MNDVSRHDGTGRPAKEVVACWSCGGPTPEDALFCVTCRAIQPPRAVTHFARLGLPVEFAIDQGELDRRYFAFQRLLHPDRFATRSARERVISQSQAVSLNEAYCTLKDPLARADYLLKQKGVAANPDGCHTINDPTLLIEQMERREALMSADTLGEVEAVIAEAASHIGESIAAISAAFRRGDIEAAGRETTRLKYLEKLLDEAKARKARLTQAPEEAAL